MQPVVKCIRSYFKCFSLNAHAYLVLIIKLWLLDTCCLLPYIHSTWAGPHWDCKLKTLYSTLLDASILNSTRDCKHALFFKLEILFLEFWLCSSFLEETTNYNNVYLCVYCSLAKDHPWAEQLVLFQVLNRKGVSMWFLQWLGAL